MIAWASKVPDTIIGGSPFLHRFLSSAVIVSGMYDSLFNRFLSTLCFSISCFGLGEIFMLIEKIFKVNKFYASSLPNHPLKQI